MRETFWAINPFVAVLGFVYGLAEAAPPGMLDPNLQVVDLSDLIAPLPLSANSSTQILSQWQPGDVGPPQEWEHSTLGNPSWPAGGHESLGYPTMVKNTHGANPDNKYYFYYATTILRPGSALPWPAP
ncbi:MAG: hypothetical protein QGF90_11040 [Gammaproteobacteria bacterium]|jgi:hypothetical protein|nr:hypothetical protein [Gammaproteobacteria bacterium]